MCYKTLLDISEGTSQFPCLCSGDHRGGQCTGSSHQRPGKDPSWPPTADQRTPHGRGTGIFCYLSLILSHSVFLFFLITNFLTHDIINIIPYHHSPQASTSSHGMLTLDLVAEEDGFSPDYDGESRESWENSFQVDLEREGSCGPMAVVGSRGLGVRQRADTDVSKLRVTSKEPKVKTGSLPRGSERSWGKQSHLEASKVHKTQQVQVGKR